MIDLSIIDRVTNDNSSSANRKKMLDLIAKAEGADYDTIVGGNKFNDFSAHPNIVGLRTKEGPSTAAGRYQITGTTYNDIAPKLGLSDFSKETQDRIALALIERAGALDLVDKGDFYGAISKLGKTWASLPSSPYSQPKRSDEWVANFIERYDNDNAIDQSGGDVLKPAQIRIAGDVYQGKKPMFQAQPSAIVTGNEGVDIPQYIAQPDANAKNYGMVGRSATKAAVDAMQYDDFLNNLTGETGGSNYLQNVIDKGMPQQKINIPMLDVDADYYGPMINVPANPSKKSSGKPIDEKAIEKEKKKLSDKIAESMVAPLRQPASTFEMPRSRIGLAMIQDRLDDINNPNRRSRMADNAAFTGMTSEDQMQQALSAKEDEYRTMVDRFNAALGLQRQKLSTQESDMDRAQQAKAFALKALEYKYDDPKQQAKMQDLEDDRKIKLIQILSRAMGRGDKAEISPTDVLKHKELLVGDGTITEEQASAIIRRGLGL